MTSSARSEASRRAWESGEAPDGKHRGIYRKFLHDSNEYSRFVETYRQKVLTKKTRAVSLPGRKNSARILYTLLGYEVQVARKRMSCPDSVTARYIRLFSELGFSSIQIPCDPTVTAELIPGFETALETLVARIRKCFPAERQTYAIRKIYSIFREQLGAR